MPQGELPYRRKLSLAPGNSLATFISPMRLRCNPRLRRTAAMTGGDGDSPLPEVRDKK
jgi:hypothetical protein